MNKLPCINCITLAICKQKYNPFNPTEARIELSSKCILLHRYLYDPRYPENNFRSFHRYFHQYEYFKDFPELI